MKATGLQRKIHPFQPASWVHQRGQNTRCAAKRVLVLGGTGFVGSEVTLAMLQLGHSVVTVSRRAKSAKLAVRDRIG